MSRTHLYAASCFSEAASYGAESCHGSQNFSYPKGRGVGEGDARLKITSTKFKNQFLKKLFSSVSASAKKMLQFLAVQSNPTQVFLNNILKSTVYYAPGLLHRPAFKVIHLEIFKSSL
jgi:hypothetical protein